MHYTLHQLKIFLKIHEHQSVTKAAEELYLTQPAVSIQLKRLQDQFEIPLTEVIGRQLYSTDFGKKIAEVSKTILEEAERINTTVDQYKGLLTGKIKISVVSTGKYVIPYFLQGFMNRYPSVEIAIDVSNKVKVVEDLSRNESDFCLVSLLPENIPIHKIELMENRLHLVGNAKYEKDKVTVKDLEKLPLILREQGSATRNVMEKYLKELKLKSYKSMELVSNEAVKQAVIAGLGFSIMPLIGLKHELNNGLLKIFPLKGLPIVTNWNLIYNKGKNLGPAASELVKFISTNKGEVVKEYFDWDVN